MSELKQKVEEILGQPATHITGRHGLPKTSDVIDYEMKFTKDGKEYLVAQLLTLIEEEIEKATLAEKQKWITWLEKTLLPKIRGKL